MKTTKSLGVNGALIGPLATREHAQVLPAVEQRRHHDRGGAERGVAQLRQLRRVGEIGRARAASPLLPDAADEAFVGADRGESGDNCRARPEWSRPAAGYRSGTSTNGGQPLERKAGVSFVPVRSDQVKRAAMRIENADRALDDQPMEIVRPNDSRKASPRPWRKSKTRVSSTWISSFERSSARMRQRCR